MLKLIAPFILCLVLQGHYLGADHDQIDQPPNLLMDLAPPSIYQTTARTIFKLGLRDDDTTSMETTITYANAEAERMREFYRQLGHHEMQDYFDAYFESYHGKIERIGQLNAADDSERNTFSIIASYILKEFWQENPEEQKYYFTVFPKHILEDIDFDVNPLSPSPHPLEYPVQISEHITYISDNDDWPSIKFQKNFTSDEMDLSYANQSEGKELHFVYLYMTKKDHVPISRLGEHRKFVTELEEHLITIMGLPVESWEEILGFKNENYLLLGFLALFYSWLIVMLTRKEKQT